MDAAARYILRTSPASALGVHQPPLGPVSGPVPVLVPISALANSAASVANASNTERSGVHNAVTADNDFMRYSTLVSHTEHDKDVPCVCCAVHPRLLQLAFQL
jgi:hypothetical protein